jgi:alcohol dehydrogenase class IV
MEVSPFVFLRPPAIHFGANSAALLGSIVSGYGTSVLWVHGGTSVARSAVSGAVAPGLRLAGLSVYEWEIASEPSPADVDRAVAEFGSEKIDAVLSVGGGSVIDAGKAISAMLTLDKPVLDYCEGVGTRQHPGTKIPFIAVPTTAGTGAEVTCNAVLSEVGPGGFKRSLRHVNLVPDVAVVDPALSLSCPVPLASACGMDALAQLLESFVSTKAGALTDALAASGLERLKDNLVPSCTTRTGDVDIRSNVSYAALLSGIALTNAGLGIVHGFASSIGGMFRIPHGVVCGTLLVPCMRRTIDKLIADGGPLHHIVKFAQAGEILCDRRGATAEETCDMLVEKLSEYADLLKLPPFSSFGITASSIDAIIDKTNNRNNPVVLTAADLRAILMNAIKGA